MKWRKRIIKKKSEKECIPRFSIRSRGEVKEELIRVWFWGDFDFEEREREFFFRERERRTNVTIYSDFRQTWCIHVSLFGLYIIFVL